MSFLHDTIGIGVLLVEKSVFTYAYWFLISTIFDDTNIIECLSKPPTVVVYSKKLISDEFGDRCLIGIEK